MVKLKPRNKPSQYQKNELLLHNHRLSRFYGKIAEKIQVFNFFDFFTKKSIFSTKWDIFINENFFEINQIANRNSYFSTILIYKVNTCFMMSQIPRNNPSQYQKNELLLHYHRLSRFCGKIAEKIQVFNFSDFFTKNRLFRPSNYIKSTRL